MKSLLFVFTFDGLLVSETKWYPDSSFHGAIEHPNILRGECAPHAGLVESAVFVCLALLIASSDDNPPSPLSPFQPRGCSATFSSSPDFSVHGGRNVVNLYVLSTLFHDGSKRLWKLNQLKAFSRSFPMELGLGGEPFLF